MKNRPLLLAALLLLGGAVQAQRDPTVAPPQAGLNAASNSTTAPPATLNADAVVRVDGKAFLVVDGRLLAPGQSDGSTQVERITESEVWLRRDGVLHKLTRYPGVLRQPPSRVAACALPATTSPRARSRPAEAACAP